MINNPIESEIDVEHKVFRDFNMRQLICIIIGAFIALLMYLFFKDVMLMVIFSLPFALILGYFSRKDDLGRPAEEIFLGKVRRHVYKNSKRTMRTKNGYVKLYNTMYRSVKPVKHKKDPFMKRLKDGYQLRKKIRENEKRAIK